MIKISAPKLLSEYGNFFNIDHTVGAKKYLLYPPNNSSPPSPDKATETSDFASLDTKEWESVTNLQMVHYKFCLDPE